MLKKLAPVVLLAILAILLLTAYTPGGRARNGPSVTATPPPAAQPGRRPAPDLMGGYSYPAPPTPVDMGYPIYPVEPTEALIDEHYPVGTPYFIDEEIP